jgi:hypothetical protein
MSRTNMLKQYDTWMRDRIAKPLTPGGRQQ